MTCPIELFCTDPNHRRPLVTIETTDPAPTPPEVLREQDAELAFLTGWVAAAGQIVGSLESWTTVYDWDGTGCESREAAVAAGWRQFGSDDFNVGRVEDGWLVWWGWMDEEHPAEDRIEVAEALGLRGSR